MNATTKRAAKKAAPKLTEASLRNTMRMLRTLVAAPGRTKEIMISPKGVLVVFQNRRSKLRTTKVADAVKLYNKFK